MNKRELAELALDLGLDVDKESGIIYGRRRDYAFYLETITDGDEFAIFFSVRCEQGYIGRDTLEALINDSEVLVDFERAGYSLACQILANQDRDLLPDILEEAIEDCTRYFEEQGLASACEKTGETGEVDLYQFKGDWLFLTPSSYERMISISQDKVTKRSLPHQSPQKIHYFLGIVGAFLTSLLGACLVFFLTGAALAMAFISGFTLLFSIACYEKFVKGISVLGIVASFFFTLTMSFLAVQIGYANSFYQGEGNILQALIAINKAALSGQFGLNYWLHYPFIVLGCVSAVKVHIQSL